MVKGSNGAFLCVSFPTRAGLQIFVQTQPDVVILEVGIGGRIDATNIIKRPAVTGGSC